MAADGETLSFSLSAGRAGRRAKRPAPASFGSEAAGGEEASREFVTTIRDGTLQPAVVPGEPAAGAAPLVIPLESSRKRLKTEEDAPSPLLRGQRGAAPATDEERFHADLVHRAADVAPKDGAYERVRIEDFGAAMLRGMGWSGPTGEDQKASESFDVKVRHHRLGLGAQPSALDTSGAQGGKGRRRRPPVDDATKAFWDEKAAQRRREESGEAAKAPKAPWAFAGVRLRVRSKTLEGGKYYKGKGAVLGADSRSVVLRMDADGALVRVKKKDCETALPKKGGAVAVLRGGEHHGARGELVSRDRDKQVATVRLGAGGGIAATVEHFAFDEVAEWVGVD